MMRAATHLLFLSCLLATDTSAFSFLVSSSKTPPKEPRRRRIKESERRIQRFAVLGGQQAFALDEIASPLETYCVSRLDEMYTRSVTIKCPFFRRRAADALDALDMVVRFLIIRHKSLDLLPPLGCRATSITMHKHKHLSMAEIKDAIQKDWHEHNLKGYYITGRLNTTIYRDDCFFDGPDPDMPVKGLRKYLSSASQLFDVSKSESELRSLRFGEEPNTIVATWRMAGVLRLPWRPSLPTMTGTTIYHIDEEGLIYEHAETWDMSVPEAFLKTFYPVFANHIWDRHCID